MFLLVVGAIALGIATPQSQEPPVPHGSGADLRARHPEIDRHQDFRSWLEAGPVSSWYETAMDSERRRTVVVQNTAGSGVFAAQVQAAAKADGATVQRTATVDLNERKQTRGEVLAMLDAQRPTQRLRRARPVVEFRDDGSWEFSWQLEVDADSKVETYRLRERSLQLENVRDRAPAAAPPDRPEAAALRPNRSATSAASAVAAATPLAPPPPASRPNGDPEFLATNELHHLSQFAQEAQGWIQGLKTTQDLAQRVYVRVLESYAYDDTIRDIRPFTWADILTRDELGRAGICDEHAVVAVTYLRALGIPARLKILSWKNERGIADAHEALEYLDGDTWRHMDPVWGAFNNPGIYREKGMTDVRVMDADEPLDVRFSGTYEGAHDVRGDARLHPYSDFVLVPQYPGNSRPGYSR